MAHQTVFKRSDYANTAALCKAMDDFFEAHPNAEAVVEDMTDELMQEMVDIQWAASPELVAELEAD